MYESKLQDIIHLIVNKVWYFAEVGVEVHHTVAEFLHILCQQLVGIGYPVVQVSHFVVCETSEEPEHKVRTQTSQETHRTHASNCDWLDS